ncbi:transketolase [Lujinxingia litoralis]|uniref:Transketolase n=1 Tax=Lujinxingia litoralis TaxID=2211119 RepID=A0A328C8R2_9DELT|nr:transketolase [Lujinxingia litoralis]RAL22315.1 transketolase [Lujinxingia litoralis]
MTDSITTLSINTIRTLSIDAVQAANSGHPGAPMGLAAVAYAIWQKHLRHDPSDPSWFNRDRFVLSNGHASMLLYSLLHLTGYEAMTLEQIKNFRQWGSLTPGHPEAELTPGVETTTGPLGQGFATAVGMAIAEAHLNARYQGVVDHYTFGICSDGDLMEGISHEAASLAGHLGLGKLIFLYDDNEITIDGRTDIAFTEDTTARFEAYGWQVLSVDDGNDVEAIDQAIVAARAESARPTLIRVKTVIGYGSPNKADTSSVHGSPLGDAEIALTKEALGWPYTERFVVPDEVREHMAGSAAARAGEARRAWEARLDTLKSESPEAYVELMRRISGELPEDWAESLPRFEPSEKGMATRASGGKVIEKIYEVLPELVGGSADLAGSNKTLFPKFGEISRGEYAGQNLHFGIREHAMAAAVNGMCLHGGVRGFGATFLVFADYMRPALRLAALMHVPQVMVFTHDSIGLGEDGPTHQPIEHLMSLRAMPNYWVLRPGDAEEVRQCWELAMERDQGPAGLVLTRQNVPTFDRQALQSQGDATQGAYILADGCPDEEPEALILATGSEVTIAVEAFGKLQAQGKKVRVISMPCWERFEQQDAAYRESVLPTAVTRRVAIEAGATLGWERYTGTQGCTLGLDHFGASAPYEELYEKFGLTAEKIVEVVNAP